MNILKVLTRSRKIGNIGEDIAAAYLKKKGYKILERNYDDGEFEIDIIAENKTALIFVEVKTRTRTHEHSSETSPSSAVTPEKQRRIIKSANLYLSARRAKKDIRLDIIEVFLNEDTSENETHHIENAFNLNTAYENRRY